MALYQDWKGQFEKMSDMQQEQYFKFYLLKEQSVYKDILANKEKEISGTIAELSKRFEMTEIEVAGFIDGINESIETPVDIENLEPETHVELKINFETLFVNMLKVPAEWLYTLEEWDNIFEPEEKARIKSEYYKSKMLVSNKIGRNEPCPCGSGKKYKNCCGKE